MDHICATFIALGVSIMTGMSFTLVASFQGRDDTDLPSGHRVNPGSSAHIMEPNPRETAEDAIIRRLWQSVVLQAFYDALLDERPPGRRHKWSTVASTSSSNVPTVKDRARFWLLECGKDFADVCGFAGMDPDVVRAGARRMLRDETSVTKARAIFAAERKKTSEGAGAEVRDLLGAERELRDLGDVPTG